MKVSINVQVEGAYSTVLALRFILRCLVKVVAVLVVAALVTVIYYNTIHKQTLDMYQTVFRLGCTSVGNPISYCTQMGQEYVQKKYAWASWPFKENVIETN